MPSPRDLYRAIAKAMMSFSLIFLVVLSTGLLAPEAQAQDAEGDYGEAAQAASVMQCTFADMTSVSAPYGVGVSATNRRECNYLDIIKAKIATARGMWQFLVVKALLSVMQNTVITMSQQMANWALSGFHGKPAFYEDGWGTFLKNTSMDLVNRFIDEADKSWGLGLCQKPTLAFKMALGINMPGMVPAPNCTLQTIVKNYKDVYHSLTPREVAKSLLDSVSIGGNDLDISLRTHSMLAERLINAEKGTTLDRLESQGLKTVKNGPLGGKIKTPAVIVNQTLAASNVVDVTKDVTVSEFNSLAMSAMWSGIKQLPLVAGMTVLSTVANALLQKALAALMEPTGESTDVQAIDLTDPYAEVQSEPKKGSALQKAYTDIISPNLISQDKLDLIDEMAMCNEPRTYWNCAIDEGIATALRSTDDKGAYTVRRATGEGGGTEYLHPDWELVPVSESKDDQDPGCYQRAYCASNLAKMRFARILPIGWELAANSPFNVKTNGKYVTLREVMAGFNNCNASNTVDAEHKWCHLIDPSWVLTSPPFMCQLKGYGDTLQVPDIAMRVQECTDLVSCLKRDDKGVCTGGYGYCLSDKTVWRFGADACDEKYVSCRTYTPRAEGFQAGKDISLIRNTVDYGSCNQDNIGCMFYATLHDTSTTSTGKWVSDISWVKNSNGLNAGINLDTIGKQGTPRVYFDSKVESCDASADGCTKVMHFTPGKSALNLVSNGSFERTLTNQTGKLDGWRAFNLFKSEPADQASFDSPNGTVAQDGSASQEMKNGLVIQTVKVYPARNYVLSFYARTNDTSGQHVAGVTAWMLNAQGQEVAGGTKYYRSANCNAVKVPGIPPMGTTENSSANVGADNLTTDWGRYTCEFVSNADAQSAVIVVSGLNAAVDAVQLEEGNAATDYADGLADGLKPDYLKLAPEEFGCTGDDKVDRSECDNFAKVCRQTEAGCQGYTEVGGGDQTEIPAILSSNDSCPNSCVGYAEYRKLPSAFDLVSTGVANDPLNDANDDSKAIFVPKYAQACTAAQAGCEELTNVEAATLGGEDKVYLTYARACQKPSDKSRTFFTWEGSETTGYQLRTWSLVQGQTGGPRLLLKAGPDGVLKDSAACNAQSWKEGKDSDCRQFYDENGTAYYAYFSQTIVSSADCRDYRKNNSDSDDCTKTGGDYQPSTSDCIYHALVSESGTCDAVNAGCRGYMGTTGRNTATVFSEAFATSTSSFYSSGSTQLQYSNEALLVGDHSLKIGGTGSLVANLDFQTTTNTLYTVSFWFKALPQSSADQATPKTVTLKLNGEAIGMFKASNDWRRFEIGPFRAKKTGKSTMTFDGPPNASFLDNVAIQRQQDVVYVRKNTWQIPAECDQTAEGIPQPQAMLGCREYHDRLGNTADVRQFSRLCSYQSVGCSGFIDTRNSDDAYARVFALKGMDKPAATGKLWDTLYSGTVTTTRQADRYIYVIDEPGAHCDSADASCRAFGKPKFDAFGAPSSTFETVYFKDDVTKYVDDGGEPAMLCRPSELFCDKFTSGPLVSYFRDPYIHLLEYKDKVTTSSTKPVVPEGEYSGWFIKDYTPPTAGYPEKQASGNMFLLQYAGTPNYRGWTAECPAEMSECTEYRDPADSSDQIHPMGKPYFFIANDTLDTKSCNGKVDLLSGCVLFRDMNNSTLPFSTGATYNKFHAQGDSAQSPVNCTTDPTSSYCTGSSGRCTNLRFIGCGSDGCANNYGPDFISAKLGAACSSDADCSHTSAQGDPDGWDVSGSCQKNDANLIIKVKMDRDCQTWLGCSSAETVYDPSQQKYVDLCTNLAVCDQVGGSTAKNFCGHYVDRNSSADEVQRQGKFLDINNYISRPTGYGKPDYSGYSIPNHFQVADLTMRRMGYELLASVKGSVRDDLYNDFRLTASVPIASSGSGPSWYATAYTDKSHPELKLCQQPQTGLIGYMVDGESPSMCHLSIEKPYSTLLSDVLGKQTQDNPDNVQQAATVFQQGKGLEGSRILSRAFPAVECRAHPDATAPFSNAFIKEWDVNVDPPVPKSFIDGYANVNYCQYGDDCSCSYRKVSFSGKNKFYSAFGGNLPAGICVGGKDDGKACDPGIVVSAGQTNTSAPAVDNTQLANNPQLPTSSGESLSGLNTCRGGMCQAYDSDSLVRGVPGQCLMRDFSRPLGGSAGILPCLIWNPSPVLVGQDDRYHYQPTAGYLPSANSGEYYCLSTAKEPKKLTAKSISCALNYDFSAFEGTWKGNPHFNCTSYVNADDSNLSSNGAEPGMLVAQPPGKIKVFHYDECTVMDSNVVNDDSIPYPYDSPGTDDDWYENLCGRSESTLDGVTANGGDSAAACGSIRVAYDGGAVASDVNAGRWVTTGRGIARNYAEYFIKFNPAAWAKWVGNIQTPTLEQVNEMASESYFTYFKFKPMYKTGVGGTWACGQSGWWVDEFPVTQSGDGWNQAANTIVKSELSQMQDLTPQNFSYLKDEKGTKLQRLPCMFDKDGKPNKDSDELCYYKYWEMGFRADGQKQFRMFWDSFGGPQKLDPKNVLFAESDGSHPFFSIRAMFEDTFHDENAVDESQMDPSGIQLSGPFRFVGWWVTASFPGATNERYIYMNMDVGNADVCREVARVKSPISKDDAAFTDRVWENGNFSVPVLGFIFSQGSSPFGAALNTRDIGQEPLYQLGAQTTQQTYKAASNRPTWLASGASYARTLSMPIANWGYLNNLFAKIYQVYRYYDQPVGQTSWACVTGPRFGSRCPDMSSDKTVDQDGGVHYKNSTECQATGCSFPLRSDGSTSAPDVAEKLCGWIGTCDAAADDQSQGQALCNSMSGVNAGLACSGSLGGTQSYHICHLAPVKNVEGELVPQYTACVFNSSGWEKIEGQDLYTNKTTKEKLGRKQAAMRGAFRCSTGAVKMPDGDLAWCRADSGGKPSPDCPVEVKGGTDSSCDCANKTGGVCAAGTSGRCDKGYQAAACKKDTDCEFTWKEWWGVDFTKNSGPPDKPQVYFKSGYASAASGQYPNQIPKDGPNPGYYDSGMNGALEGRGTAWWTGNEGVYGETLGTDLQDPKVDIAHKNLTGSRIVWRSYVYDGPINSEDRFPGSYIASRTRYPKVNGNDKEIFIPGHCEMPPVTNSLELCKKIKGPACDSQIPDVPYLSTVTGICYGCSKNTEDVNRYIGDPAQPWKFGKCKYGVYENRSCSRDTDCAPMGVSEGVNALASDYCQPVTINGEPSKGGERKIDGYGYPGCPQGIDASTGKCKSASQQALLDAWEAAWADPKQYVGKKHDFGWDCRASTGDSKSKDLDKDNNMCTHYAGYYPRPDLCGGDLNKTQCLTGIQQQDAESSVTTKSFDLRKVLPPTDVSSGLHLPPYLASQNPGLSSSDYSANYSYMAYYAPRPPTIAAPDTSRQCAASGQCPVAQVGAFSLEGSAEGKVAYVGGQVLTNIRFYGWATDNQMGLKDMWVDWGDKTVQEFHDARMKNKKPICGSSKECAFIPGLGCNSDNDCPPAGGKCENVGFCAAKPQIQCVNDTDCYDNGLDTGDKCQSRLTFGNSDDACEQNYFEFAHVYTCPKGVSLQSCQDTGGAEIKRCSRDNDRVCKTVADCAKGDTCLVGMAPPGGCFDKTNNACRFTPRVLLKDNWGWCTGECRQQDLGGGKLGAGFNYVKGIIGETNYNNILLPYGGCYDATGISINRSTGQALNLGNGGTSDTNTTYNMCDPYKTAKSSYRPWIVFKGAMQLGVGQ